MANIKIISTGSCLDGKVVTNDELSEIMDTNDAWITQRTGIKSRIVSELSAAELGAKALERALEKVEISYEDIDVFIVATYTSQDLMPNTANMIKKILDIKTNAVAFDVNVACSGFVYAMEIANGLAQLGTYKTFAIIGTETHSQYVDFSDRSTAILFGDGAGAIIFQVTDSQKGMVKSVLGTKVDVNNTLNLTHIPVQTPFSDPEVKVASNKITMKGQEVFQFALITVKQAILDVLSVNELKLEDVDYFVLHQANWRIIDAIARSLKIESEKFISNINHVANTSAASIPIVLDEFSAKNDINNKCLLFVGFGAGLAYGATIVNN